MTQTNQMTKETTEPVANTDSNTNATPIATENKVPVDPSPVAANQDDSAQYVTLPSLLIIAVITMMLTLAAVYLGASKGYFALSGNVGGQKVVLLDPDRLIQAGLKAHQAMGTVADAQADADKFQIDLKAEIDRLTNEGYMVLNSRAAIAIGKNMDVTDEVIGRLGIAHPGKTK